MTRIFGILNAYDHRNRGDRAIIEAQIAWLKSKFPDAEFRVFSPAWEANIDVFGEKVSQPPPIRTEDHGGFFTNIVKPLKASLAAAFGSSKASPAFKECDAYFLCGGGYLYSSTARGLSRQLWMHAGNSMLALNTGKPVMQFPQSWGPITKVADRWICKKLASKLPRICSRGEASTALVDQWGFLDKVVGVPDIVVPFGELKPELVKQCPEGNGELGIAPINYGFAQQRSDADGELYLQRVSEVAAGFMKEGGKGITIFPQVQVEGKDDDLVVALELEKRLVSQAIPCRVIQGVSWENYFVEVSQMSVFLGSRMHACIFALVSGIPTVGLSYQPKFEALFGQLKMSDRCVPIADFDPAEVAIQIGKLAKNETARRDVMTAVEKLSGETLGGLKKCWNESGLTALNG